MWQVHIFIKNFTGQCIPIEFVDDGTYDCGDGSDETARACDEMSEFTCNKSGKCVHLEFINDGHTDCPDKTDETTFVRCNESYEYRCNVSMECIDRDKVFCVFV